jgi:hypothetical protein
LVHLEGRLEPDLPAGLHRAVSLPVSSAQ